jgi:predicted Zn-dependent protease with MMP-like domain
LTPAQRDRFDSLLEEALDALPEPVRELLDQVPLVVEDRPSRELLDDLAADGVLAAGEEDLCGLHTGIALTERSVEHSGHMPDRIQVFRQGIVSTAGGWNQPDADDAVYEEIMITLLHEIGHHFGLDEEDLAELGYD